MRLAILSLMEGSTWGGSEELWYRTALLARKRGWDVHVLAFPDVMNSDAIGKLRKGGCEISDLDYPRGNSLASRVKRRLVPPLGSIVKFKPDVLLVSNSHTFFWTSIPGIERVVNALHSRSARVYMVCHSNNDNWRLDDWTQTLARRVWPTIAGVGFCAGVMKDLTERQLLMRLDNGFVFKNPVNLTSLEALSWPLDEPAKFATVCRLDSNKGVDLALRVLASLRWRERGWRFDIYGDGELRGYLEKLAVFLGHTDRVRFRGPTRNVRDVWEDNHALLLTSRLEGLPLAMVEAAICGRVIITTDVGGVRDWCEAAGSPFVAAAASYRAVEETMESAWAARAQWKQIGQRARDYAMTWYGNGPEEEMLDRLGTGANC